MAVGKRTCASPYQKYTHYWQCEEEKFQDRWDAAILWWYDHHLTRKRFHVDKSLVWVYGVTGHKKKKCSLLPSLEGIQAES